MKFLRAALRLWFDCFQELEQELKIDLRQTLREVPVPATPPEPTSQQGKPEESRSSRKKVGFWWTEQVPQGERGAGGFPEQPPTRYAVACSALEGQTFVSFCEDGVETFSERDDAQLAGVFVKAIGKHGPRQFKLPAPQPNGKQHSDDNEARTREALDPISLWVD